MEQESSTPFSHGGDAHGAHRRGDESWALEDPTAGLDPAADLEVPSVFPTGAVPISAGLGELVIGAADLAGVRGALAQLGVEGSADLDSLTAEQAISVMTGLRRLTAAISAVEARAVTRLEQAIREESRARGESGRTAARIARSEASMALEQSPSAASRTLASCRRLVTTMPGMLHALAIGRVHPTSAHRVSRALSRVTAAQRGQVDEVLTHHLGDLEDCGGEEWGDQAARVLHALDPEGAAARHERAKRRRTVTVRNADDGMAVVTATVTALDAARIRRSLSLGAEKARAGGDRRGHQAIMADLFTDALLGRNDEESARERVGTLDIGVIITDRSLLAPGHSDAATIEGLGTVPYEHVRQEMLMTLRSAEGDDPDLAISIRHLYLEQDTGQLVAAESRSRAFPPAMARLLRWSHQTCRGPFCDAPIRQLDHIRPHAAGGPTALDNGNGLCAGCNQKESAGRTAQVITDEHGTRRTVEWRSRYGQTARRSGIDFDPLHTAERRALTPARPAPPLGPGTARDCGQHRGQRGPFDGDLDDPISRRLALHILENIPANRPEFEIVPAQQPRDSAA